MLGQKWPSVQVSSSLNFPLNPGGQTVSAVAGLEHVVCQRFERARINPAHVRIQHHPAASNWNHVSMSEPTPQALQRLIQRFFGGIAFAVWP